MPSSPPATGNPSAQPRQHEYAMTIVWTGNRGDGTTDYHSYGRDHEIHIAGKPVIEASADPAFRGDADRVNPEEMLVASLSACHMLWYLHLAADAGIVVTGYEDKPEGMMEERANGGGNFKRVTLSPRVTIAEGCDPEAAIRLHETAHRKCFIANSVSFPVYCQPELV